MESDIMLLTEFARLPLGSLVSHRGVTGNVYMKIGADMYLYLGIVRAGLADHDLLRFMPSNLFQSVLWDTPRSFDSFVHTVEGFAQYDPDVLPTQMTEYEPCKPEVEQVVRATSLVCKLL